MVVADELQGMGDAVLQGLLFERAHGVGLEGVNPG